MIILAIFSKTSETVVVLTPFPSLGKQAMITSQGNVDSIGPVSSALLGRTKLFEVAPDLEHISPNC